MTQLGIEKVLTSFLFYLIGGRDFAHRTVRKKEVKKKGKREAGKERRGKRSADMRERRKNRE